MPDRSLLSTRGSTRQSPGFLRCRNGASCLPIAARASSRCAAIVRLVERRTDKPRLAPSRFCLLPHWPAALATAMVQRGPASAADVSSTCCGIYRYPRRRPVHTLRAIGALPAPGVRGAPFHCGLEKRHLAWLITTRYPVRLRGSATSCMGQSWPSLSPDGQTITSSAMESSLMRSTPSSPRCCRASSTRWAIDRRRR